MNTDNIWEILEIENSLEHAQVLFSYIDEHTIGSIEEKGLLKNMVCLPTILIF